MGMLLRLTTTFCQIRKHSYSKCTESLALFRAESEYIMFIMFAAARLATWRSLMGSSNGGPSGLPVQADEKRFSAAELLFVACWRMKSGAAQLRFSFQAKQLASRS